MTIKTNPTRTAFRIILCAAAAAILAAGCTGTIDTRGNVPDPEVLARIKPGVQTRDQVREMLGTPSTVATFERENIWFYIGGRVKSVAFFKPEVLERKVVAVTFDKNGRVKLVRGFDANKERNFDLVERETPTKGKELTVLQQLVGNIGRFSTPKDADRE